MRVVLPGQAAIADQWRPVEVYVVAALCCCTMRLSVPAPSRRCGCRLTIKCRAVEFRHS
jgi:hypothetical protein